MSNELDKLTDSAQARSLEESLEGITDENRHPEVDWGAAVGKEEWMYENSRSGWGKRPGHRYRTHERPKAKEVEACMPWLAAELKVVKPRILVCLGATAAQALLGKDFRVTRERGKWLVSPMAERVLATVHPSSILRAYDTESRERQYRNL